MSEFVDVWMAELVSTLGEKVQFRKASPRPRQQQHQEEKPFSLFINSPPKPIKLEPFHASTLSETTICLLLDRFTPC
uniref:Uncharacterized protein n=1 Tax=Nelumbo nucifera TaxID=4432 RepID=A0A822ZTM2_NELNU|nr:TPA_asm: hypothetical protein HUJ06_016818 [Nelumbo nucifera]